MKQIKIGQDIITPKGYGEVVEILSETMFLVEYPNRTRESFNIKEVLQ